MQYGNIKENKELASMNKDEDANKGFGYDDSIITGKKEKKKASGGALNFNFNRGPPRFTKTKKNAFQSDFQEGLDDLDDEGNVKQKRKEERAQGQREFINLGSTA